MILETKKLSKIYGTKEKGVMVSALNQVSISIQKGEFVAIMGPSGSGKSTLLQILGTIDTPTSGQIYIDQVALEKLNDQELADFRRDYLGFIFQDFQLLDSLTLQENILLPLIFQKQKEEKMFARLTELSELLGITGVLNHRPYQVSGGQKQRAAAARALIHNPALVLADEPTGNLDSKAAKDLMSALSRLNQVEKATILMVTHDSQSASYANRVMFLKDGKLYHEIYRQGDRGGFYQEILKVQAVLGGENLELLGSDLSKH